MRIIKTDGASAKEVSEAKELSLRPEYYRCDYCGVAMHRDGHEKCPDCPDKYKPVPHDAAWIAKAKAKIEAN